MASSSIKSTECDALPVNRLVCKVSTHLAAELPHLQVKSSGVTQVKKYK